MRSHRTIACLAACLAPVALAGCGDAGGSIAAHAGPSAPPPAVVRGDLQPRVLLTGELAAVRAERVVVPRTPSWQVPIRWIADDGSRVRRGDVVVELDNSQFTGDLEQKRLAESAARNELIRQEAEIAGRIADREFAVEQKRVALEKARLAAEVPETLRPRRDFEEDRLTLETARIEHAKAVEDLAATRAAAEAELDVLRAELTNAREEIQVAEDAIDALALRSPADGIFVVAVNPREDRKWQTGDNAWVGAAVARVPDLTAMKVDADLSDVDDGAVLPGMRARCVVDTYPGRDVAGTVTEITPIAQELGRESLRRRFRVTVAVDETDGTWLLPGMSARVEVLPEPLRDRLLVPRFALRVDEDAAAVALLAGGGEAPVRLGPCDAWRCVVEDGLDEGARLRGSG